MQFYILVNGKKLILNKLLLSNFLAIQGDHSTYQQRCKIANENSSRAIHEYPGEIIDDDEPAVHVRYIQIVHPTKSTESDY